MIELRKVTKEYSKGNAALNGVSVKIERGEFVFIVGDSGSGKSTLIKLIMKELNPTEGTIIVNTEMMEENDLPMPESIADLADPVYEGFVSVTDISASSTAWLLVQALVSEYGEDGAKDILTGIYENVGDHLEDSGSAPLKKVRAGEVAIGFGLRQQAVADKADGLPIDYIDPAEGNFSLTESVAIVDKGDDTNPLAMEMAQCIIENGREELQSYYPNALYNGEETDAANKSANPKVFPEKLTVDLLEQHQAISEEAKAAAGM